MTKRALPHIVVVAMGGTIAGSAATSTDTTGYRAATATVDELLAAVPEVGRLARVTGEQFAQIDSSDLTDAHLMGLARRIDDLLISPDVDGVVVTHGTDTLEETAYFLHLVLASEKPVVLVGSMRPASALSADGPMNIFSAVAVAASPVAWGHGVLVVMNNTIHSARDVTKSSSLNVQSFESPHGPLGVVVDGTAVFYRAVTRPHTSATEFTLGGVDALPRAAIIYAHSGLDAAFVDRVVDGNYAVIVHAGFGNGTVPGRIVDSLERARTAGTVIVRATRTGSAQLTTIGAGSAVTHGWVAVADQNPQRARILACLALTVTQNPAEIQRMFHTY